MINVFKLTLEIKDEQKVQLQKGSSILKCEEQHDKITLWYLCDPEAELSEETFYVVGTGQQLPDTFPGLYVGTAQVGPLVWHVFFKKKPNVQRRQPIVATPNPNDDAASVSKRGNDNGA